MGYLYVIDYFNSNITEFKITQEIKDIPTFVNNKGFQLQYCGWFKSPNKIQIQIKD